ncbi:sulfurtransferase TusA family protein [Pseudothermotoga sp. U03pept]|uniref:sulfurtransferase TusA family protein n=1 Tax=Pseudothermotoga sp. U03pept TaxID=3447012 RepID=UPI003F07D59E
MVELLKVLANQRRLEILMLLTEECMTTKEVAEKLKIDLSTAFRYLNQMVKYGLLKVVRSKEGDRYDIASEHVFHILQEISMHVLGSVKSYDGSMVYYVIDAKEVPKPQLILDMRGEICPIPELQTRKKLQEMNSNDILMVIVDYPISKERILSYCQRSGYKAWVLVQGVETTICIQKP